jgi:hypothetical protein
VGPRLLGLALQDLAQLALLAVLAVAAVSAAGSESDKLSGVAALEIVLVRLRQGLG